MRNKHKIVASNLCAFEQMFDHLKTRLEQCGQVICKVIFSWDNDACKGYRAKLWSIKAEGGAE